MTTAQIDRPARLPAPALPRGELAVPAPPVIPASTGTRWSRLLVALPMLAGTAATAMMFAGRQGGLYSYVVGGVFGLSSLGMLATSLGGAGRARRADVNGLRREYMRALGATREQARATAAEQRAALEHRHPAAGVLWAMVDTPRVWERRAGDIDFGVVRVGAGPQRLATPLAPPITNPADELEPASTVALRRFLDTYALAPGLPVALALFRFRRVLLRGPGARALARAMLASVTFFASPEEVAVAICAAPARRHQWEYAKWLPHARHPSRQDAAGPARLFADSWADLPTLLAGVTAKPVVIRDGQAGDDDLEHACLIDIEGRGDVADAQSLAITVDAAGRMTTDGGGGAVEAGVAEALSVVEAEALARLLTPLGAGLASTPSTPPDLSFGGLLRLGDIGRLDVGVLWRSRPLAPRLATPIGVDGGGRPVMLDLKESALGGMGPHGLVIGATGSGKSELLRALVLGLAATHDSADLNFVLIDFKGGATFASLDRLPHTAAVITNLADELPLVDRMADALNGELVRRQELLRRAGNVASAREYAAAREQLVRRAGGKSGAGDLPRLPVLLVVCDEFSELLSAKPEFIDLFVAMGRLGRSLGVHLLLASQRLDEGRLRGLETHLSYRIGLRTFSAIESRAVLGVPDAYELPREPGHGYLRYGTEPLLRFKSVYVSGPVPPERHVSRAASSDLRVVPFTSQESLPDGSAAGASPLALPAPPRSPDPDPGPVAAGAGVSADADMGATSVLECVVAQLQDAGVPAHRIWLPPLDRSDPLERLLGPLAVAEGRGLSTADPRAWGHLRAPVAIIDRPFAQRREPLVVDLSGAAGHVAIVGGPQSGKSTLLRTLISALALTHTPSEATFYGLDFGGGALAALTGLPHVGAVAGRHEPDAVRRIVGEVAAVLDERERDLGAAGLANARTGPGGLGRHGDMFLVVDGWATLRSEYDELETRITDIATRGLSRGVHVLVTAGRWADLRPALRDLLNTRLELRLGDPSDSAVGRKAAANVPERAPGRGLVADGGHFLAAGPTLSAGADLVRAVAEAWTGPSAPPVRELPAMVTIGEITESAGTGEDVPGGGARVAGGSAAAERSADLRIPIGLVEPDLRPVCADFTADPHLLVFGDGGCGKSSFLRTLATSITRRLTPEEARIVVVDYRRAMLGELTTPHLIGFAATSEQAAPLLESVAAYMRNRLPGPDVTPAQLKARSWWTGPECFVLVDDWDLVATGGSNPVGCLLDLLPQARDVGLHLVAARRSGGAARAMYEPVLARLRELGAPGLLMSGSQDEGVLINAARPRSLPPGRAILDHRRDGMRLVQLAYAKPTA